jgi:hypothetical protein
LLAAPIIVQSLAQIYEKCARFLPWHKWRSYFSRCVTSAWPAGLAVSDLHDDYLPVIYWYVCVPPALLFPRAALGYEAWCFDQWKRLARLISRLNVVRSAVNVSVVRKTRGGGHIEMGPFLSVSERGRCLGLPFASVTCTHALAAA